MWTIRQEQVDTFKQAALQKFEDQMVEHLKQFASRHWKIMGEPDGRKVIRLGIERAKQYGLTNRGPVRFYIELMFMFGSYFDTDRQYPWASEILNAPEQIDQTARADRLYEAMNEYVAQVPGPSHKFFLEALERMSEVRIESVVKSGVPLEECAVRELGLIYPQTCDYLGELRVKAIIEQGFENARHHGFTTAKGMLLMAALTFFMGHGFAKDPLCSWISRRLDSKRFPDPTARTEELYAKANLYMKHVLAESARS